MSGDSRLGSSPGNDGDRVKKASQTGKARKTRSYLQHIFSCTGASTSGDKSPSRDDGSSTHGELTGAGQAPVEKKTLQETMFQVFKALDNEQNIEIKDELNRKLIIKTIYKEFYEKRCEELKAKFTEANKKIEMANKMLEDSSKNKRVSEKFTKRL